MLFYNSFIKLPIKYIYRLIFLIGLWLIIYSTALAQPVNTLVGDVVMPPPNAAALGKYGDIPVSLYTGVPDIAIPIHTINEGPLSLPISLSYHASGVKVAETASWVGLGWSLNCGGVISRTVQGIPDEGWGGYLTQGSTIPPALNGLDDFNKLREIQNGQLDGEPDIFSFNVGGYSGKFYIDADPIAGGSSGEVVFVPKSDLKVEYGLNSSAPNNERLESFTVTGTDGTRFYFGKHPDPNSNQFPIEAYKTDNTDAIRTSWYLVRIESTDAIHHIDLEYVNESYSYKNLKSCQSENPNIDVTCNSANRTYILGNRLSKITSTFETVTFNATSLRADLDAYNSSVSRRLNNIQISTGTTSIFCKRFNFHTSYFKDTHPLYGNNTDSEHFRLRLDKLEEISCSSWDSSEKGAYTFDYHQSSNFDNDYLPNRLSKAIDHWGFYNGELANNENEFNIPDTEISYFQGGLPYSLSAGNSERDSREAPMLIGTLSKITYPTNGSSFFEFEANDHYGLINTVPNYLVNIERPCASGSTNSNPNIYNGLEEYNLTIDPEGPACGPADPGNCFLRCYEVGISFPIQTRIYHFEPGDLIQSNNTLTTLFPNVTFSPSKQYTFEIESQHASVSFEVMGPPTEIFGNKKVGGLRVKKITTHDGLDISRDIVKTFRYRQSGNSAISSGKLYQQPSYGTFQTIATFCVAPDPNCVLPTCNYSGIPSNWCQYYVYNYYDQPLMDCPTRPNQLVDCYFVNEGVTNVLFMDNSIVPLGSFNGYHIGYAHVEELHNDAGQENGNGSIEYSFYTEDPYYDDNLNYPFPPAQIRTTEGKTVAQITKNANGEAEAISSSIPLGEAYEYNSNNILKVTSFQNGRLYFNKYVIRTRADRLASQTTTIDNVTTTTSYSYDPNDNHLMPISSEFQNSDGTIYRNSSSYTFDLGGALYREMEKRNMIVMPIEQRTEIIDGGTVTQIDGSRTLFSSFLGGLPSPTVNDTLKIYPYRQLRYERTWDEAGNILPGNWEIKASILKYGNGLPTKAQTQHWEPEILEWQWDRIHKRIYEGQEAVFDYYPGTRMVQRITAKDGQISTFQYDGLSRLKQSLALGGNVKMDYSYNYESVQGNYNYVNTKTSFTPTTGSDLQNLEERQYLDGLGRPIQNIKIGYSPNQKDVISAFTYDNQGRRVKAFIPFEGTGSSGTYNSNFSTQPFSETTYYPSPLNRAFSTTPPGWNPTILSYSTNTAGEVLKNDGSNEFYLANELTKTVVTDPDNKQNIKFKDKKGREVLSRRKKGSQTADTYYIFDPKSRLKCVLPPGGDISNQELIYKYSYDAADNQITKKIPGSAIQTIVYNNRDLPVASNDGQLQSQNKWIIQLFDNFGRNTRMGYHIGNIPDPNNLNITSDNLLSESFYDGYNGSNTNNAPQYLGKLKKSRVKVLEENGLSNVWMENEFVYDVHGRATSISATNHLGETELTSMAYDWAGNVLEQTRNHNAFGNNLVQIDKINFDHSGRQKDYLLSIDGGATYKHLSHYEYTVRDQLRQKKLGITENNALQQIDQVYNTMGWLTGINSVNSGDGTMGYDCLLSPTGNPDTGGGPGAGNIGLFSLQLKYGSMNANYGLTASQNGNISEIIWRVKDRQRQAYGFSYDFQDRLTQTVFGEYNPGSNSVTVNNKFSTAYAYDQRGNFTSLTRQGQKLNGDCYQTGQIDDLTYEYYDQSNRLKRVIDNAANDCPPVRIIDQQVNAGGIYDAQDKVIASSQLNANNTAVTYQAINQIKLDNGFSFDPDGNADETFKALPAPCDGLPSPLDFGPEGFEQTSNDNYEYDANGNMTKDPNKRFNISYNYLNLPYKVISFDGTQELLWEYTASGEKLRKTVKENGILLSVKDYIAGIEYTNDEIEAIYHAEGRLYNVNVADTVSGTIDWRYEYNLQDHLGNTRITFSDLDNDGEIITAEIIQENHYYPFGMTMKSNWFQAENVENFYQYNGKELNEDFGLNWNDYGARWYDSALGRFTSVDPLAEQYTFQSTYVYAANNPISNIDILGMAAASMQELIAKVWEQGEGTYDNDGNKSTKKDQDVDSEMSTVIFNNASKKRINKGLQTGNVNNVFKRTNPGPTPQTFWEQVLVASGGTISYGEGFERIYRNQHGEKIDGNEEISWAENLGGYFSFGVGVMSEIRSLYFISKSRLTKYLKNVFKKGNDKLHKISEIYDLKYIEDIPRITPPLKSNQGALIDSDINIIINYQKPSNTPSTYYINKDVNYNLVEKKIIIKHIEIKK